jgi:hypothetical protein
MLYLQDLFDQLAYGKFSNMAVGNSVTKSIKEEGYKRIISVLNTGLYDLYTRLVLKKKEFTLYQRSGVTRYYLRPDNIGNVNCGDPNVYIDDQDDPIEQDIVRLLEAYDSEGEPIRIKDKNYPDDIFIS